MNLPELSQAVFIGLIIILQIADGWTTYDCLRAGGKEANPLMRELMSRIGMREALWVAKLAVTGALIYWPVTNTIVQWVNLALFAAVVVNNLIVLKKLKAR